MTKKIIAFGASSSKQSINKQLATFAANQFQNVSVEILDLNDYEMPIFSVDKEKEKYEKIALDENMQNTLQEMMREYISYHMDIRGLKSESFF